MKGEKEKQKERCLDQDGKTPLELADIAANQSYWRASDKENFAKIIQFLEDKEAEK